MIIVFVWPVTDLIASHDVGLITGPTRAAALQTAREAVRTQMLTLGAGVFAAGALVYTAQNFSLSRSTFRATEKRVLNERFIAITAQLGDSQAAVRLAGVHAMAGLADDWPENRQTCVDVLCAYLRIPYEPDPGEDALESKRLAFGASREVRHTVIGVITRHLQPDAVISWQGLNFDFTSVVFDGGDFRGAQFIGGEVDFVGAQFIGGTVDFGRALFSGDTAVGPGHRRAPPHPDRPHRPGRRGGVQPGRAAAGQRRRRRDGTAVGPGHRRAPPHPDRPHRPGPRGGVQPGRAAAGQRRRRRDGTAVGPGHRRAPAAP